MQVQIETVENGFIVTVFHLPADTEGNLQVAFEAVALDLPSAMQIATNALQGKDAADSVKTDSVQKIN